MDQDLVEFCRRFFLGNPEDVERFQADPERVLAEEGLREVTPVEIHEALVLASEAPVDQGADVSVGGVQTVGAAPAPAPAPAPVAPPPPPPPPPAPEMSYQEYVTHVHEYYVTNNNTTETFVDDRDTNIDNTNIVQAEEGAYVTIDQDTAVSGDGGVSNTGTIEDAQIVTGDVGDGSTVIGGDIDDSQFGDDNNQANDNSGNAQAGGTDNTIQDVDGEGNQVANSEGDVEQNDMDINFGGGGGNGGGEQPLPEKASNGDVLVRDDGFGRGPLLDQGGDQAGININQGSGSADQTQEDNDEVDIGSPDIEITLEAPADPAPPVEAELLRAEVIEEAPVDDGPDDDGMLQD